MMPFICNVPTDKFIETEDRWINDCLGLGGLWIGMSIMVQVSFWSDKNVVKLDCDYSYTTLNIL